jgi:hypothetical protein
MILFCVTECPGSFKVAAKKFAAGFPTLQSNAIYCRQTLYLVQANAIYWFFLQAHK